LQLASFIDIESVDIMMRRRRFGVRQLAAAFAREASFAQVQSGSKLPHSKGFASLRIHSLFPKSGKKIMALGALAGSGKLLMQSVAGYKK
jgi:hypothetical protein